MVSMGFSEYFFKGKFVFKGKLFSQLPSSKILSQNLSSIKKCISRIVVIEFSLDNLVNKIFY